MTTKPLPPSLDLAPKATRERTDVLDILRGFAILLIFLFNIPAMGNTAYADFMDVRLLGWTPADRICWTFLNIFLEGTQRGLLQFLFGAGALILLEKTMLQEGPVKVVDLYFRRNIWLAVFGLFDIYGLLWFGDILFSYSLPALFLFPFRRFSAMTLLILGLAFAGGKAVQGAIGFHRQLVVQRQVTTALEKQTHGDMLDPADRKVLVAREKQLAPFSPAMFAEERAARLGSFSRDVSWTLNFSTGIFSNDLVPWLPRMIRNFFCLVMGMAFFKLGITQGRRSTRFYVWLCLCCYAPGLLLRVISTWQEVTAHGSPNIASFAGEAARLAVTIGHIALINLTIRTSFGRRLLAPFKAAGRTAFSLYLMQNFLGMLVLFPSFGFGLWGRYGWFGLTMIALAVIAAQLILANLWLRWFAIGPLEWVWRSLAYKHLQPFRRRRAIVV